MKTFRELIYNYHRIICIPPYQRAYAWGEEQIEQFINDLIEMQNKTYYYGHFILEETDDKTVEVIDGQQRITTFMLFILSSKLYLNYALSSDDKMLLRNRFKTIKYDSDRFKQLVEAILEQNTLIKTSLEDKSSIKRIVIAIECFKTQFQKIGESKNVESLIKTILNAEISVHKAKDKKVAVQIFELQNSRGISLDLMEKFKSRLMKEIYLHSPDENAADKNIKALQDDFAHIYALEEKTAESSFRGDLKLDNILLHHLRVIDDGTKKEYNDFFSPAIGKIEENVLKYISDKLNEKENLSDKEKYILNLSKLFKESVEFVCDSLIDLDEKKPLVGDCIILDKIHSLELFLLLLHHKKIDELDLTKWELLLYTRDFHSQYHGLHHRDNFQGIYSQILNENKGVNEIINFFVTNGFVGKLNGRLQDIFIEDVLNKNEDSIKKRAFNFWKEKMTYLLYKYEIENFDTPTELRKEIRILFKKGKSIEHTLPQNWIELIENSDNNEVFRNSINSRINGIGNLMIIGNRENSREGNKHPKVKNYDIKEFGNYAEHEKNKDKWANHENWAGLIDKRGEKIYHFMKTYFSVNFYDGVK